MCCAVVSRAAVGRHLIFEPQQSLALSHINSADSPPSPQKAATQANWSEPVRRGICPVAANRHGMALWLLRPNPGVVEQSRKFVQVRCPPGAMLRG